MQPGKCRKHTANTSIDPVDKHLLTIILQNSKPPPPQAKQPEYDDNKLFCLSMSCSLKKLAPPQQEYAKLQMQQVTYNIQFDINVNITSPPAPHLLFRVHLHNLHHLPLPLLHKTLHLIKITHPLKTTIYPLTITQTMESNKLNAKIIQCILMATTPTCNMMV